MIKKETCYTCQQISDGDCLWSIMSVLWEERQVVFYELLSVSVKWMKGKQLGWSGW